MASALYGRMLTLRDINLALDRPGIEAFIPHTAPRVAVRERRSADPNATHALPYRASEPEES